MAHRSSGSFASNIALAAGGAALLTAGLAALVAGANGIGQFLDSEPDQGSSKPVSAKKDHPAAIHYAKLDKVLSRTTDRVRRWLALSATRVADSSSTRGLPATVDAPDPESYPAVLKFRDLLASHSLGDGVPDSIADVIERFVRLCCIVLALQVCICA